jgi:trimeric autotransporter adhesin
MRFVTRYQIRTDTAARWAAVNPTLRLGEWAAEVEAGALRLKIGNGVTAWNDLAYFGGGSGGEGGGPYQPLDSDLTAIAGLGTTSWGRALLTLIDAAAARSTLGLGTAATSAASAFDAAGTAAAAVGAHAALADPHPGYTTAAELSAGLATRQPIDDQLTQLAAAAITSFGVGMIEAATDAAARTLLGLGTAATAASSSFEAAGAVAAHAGALDPHPGYTTDAELSAAVASHAAATDPHGDRAYTDTTVAAAIAALIDSAPGTIDTLNELAAALGDDPNFAATMTTALAGKQPVSSNLTAVSALVTQAFGLSLLETLSAGAARTLLGLGTAATSAASAFDPAGSAAAAQAASQPASGNLTTLAAVTSGVTGRDVLAATSQSAARTALGLGSAATAATTAFDAAGSAAAAQAAAIAASQPASASLTTLAGVTSGTSGRAVLAAASAAEVRTAAGVGTLSEQAAGAAAITGGSITGTTYRSKARNVAGSTDTLSTADDGGFVFYATGCTVTLPNNLPVGFSCALVQESASAVVTSAQSGGTRTNRQSHTRTGGQWATVTVYVRANVGGTAAQWVLAGDTAA